MIKDVQFEEPADLQIQPRKLIQREPGALSRTLMKAGVVRSVLQAKIFITIVVLAVFFGSIFMIEAAVSGPDIPPRPPLTPIDRSL